MIHKAASLRDNQYLVALLKEMDSRPQSRPRSRPDSRPESRPGSRPQSRPQSRPGSTPLEEGDKDGATALMLACQRENVDNVKTLLKRKVAFVWDLHEKAKLVLNIMILIV